MNSVSRLLKIARNFEYKLHTFAQQQSPQAGDIEKALSDGGTKPTPDQISPILDKVGFPENLKADIKVNVIPPLKVNFKSIITDEHNKQVSFPKLDSALNATFSKKMEQTLKSTYGSITNSVEVGIATF